jgi:hypothetical protein
LINLTLDLVRLLSFKASSEGITVDINCTIIDAEMYGIIPRARMDIRSNAPPENMLNKPRIVPWFALKRFSSAALLMPGTGICAPSRKHQ